MEDTAQFIHIDGQRIEYRLFPAQGGERPTLVLLHEGLGSLTMWRDFPARLAAATGCRTLVWSRLGHGFSAPLRQPRTPRYLHEEALQRLPPLLDALSIKRPVLIGHSDGGTIALIYAAERPDAVAAVVVMAPHEFVENQALSGIRRAVERYQGSDWPRRLAAHHHDADAVFRAWSATWLSPEFADWSIKECLPRLLCPVLAIQGEEDEYATLRQIECLAEAAADVELLPLRQCRHSPHRDQPEAVLAAICRFINRLKQTGRA